MIISEKMTEELLIRKLGKHGLFQRSPYSRELREEENMFFYATLDHHLRKVSYAQPSKPKILNLGCGMMIEGDALKKYFGEYATILGIDKSRMALMIADSFNKDNGSDFVVADAGVLDSLLKEKFDVILNRHPNLGRVKNTSSSRKRIKDWFQIYQSVKNLLNKKGIIFATTIIPDESFALTKILKQNDYDILLDLESSKEFDRMLGNPYQYIDPLNIWSASETECPSGRIKGNLDRYVTIAKSKD